MYFCDYVKWVENHDKKNNIVLVFDDKNILENRRVLRFNYSDKESLKKHSDFMSSCGFTPLNLIERRTFVVKSQESIPNIGDKIRDNNVIGLKDCYFKIIKITKVSWIDDGCLAVEVEGYGGGTQYGH